MKYPIYAYRDALNGFGGLILNTNDNAMIRKFSQDINNAPDMVFSPKDYALYKLGEFDADKGTIKSEMPVMLVDGAAVFVQKKE